MSAGGRVNNGTRFRAPLSVYSDTKSTTVALFDANGFMVTSTAPATVDANAALPISPGHYGSLRAAHVIFDFAVDGGAVAAITPVQTVVLPANTIIVAGTVNVVAAVTSLGSATVSIGTSAGSSAASILAATAKASLTLAAIINAVPVFATPVKLSAAGSVTFTVAAAALTAGKIELWLFYMVASNA